MPLYEYECQKCEKVHEIMQKFSDPLMKDCPDCSGPVQKLMSLSSFSLKGTGWYTTDYKRKSDSKSTGNSGTSEAKDEVKAGAKTAVKADAKTEAKTEAKPESKPAASAQT